jgi:chromosome segregation ATPase
MITSVAQDDLEQRMIALEQEQARLREHLRVAEGDAGAARALAAGADRDTSEVRTELRAHLKALNALRETQREIRETQLEQGERLGALEHKVDDGFAKLSVGMAEINTLLKRLEPDPGAE